jgi:HK97 family phage prohead protease
MPVTGFGFEVKELNDQGHFEGWASVYGVTDLTGDVVEPGAFTRTLADSGKERPLLWSHSTSAPVGKVQLTDTPNGLRATGQLALGISQAKDAYVALKEGILKGLSIGYDTIRAVNDDKGIRHLLEVKLWEVSLVMFPACPPALIQGVKNVGMPANHQQILAALRSFKTDVVRALETTTK